VADFKSEWPTSSRNHRPTSNRNQWPTSVGIRTLVQAGAPIDPKTYFRNVLFNGAAWRHGATATGQPLEIARVRFEVDLPGQRQRRMDLEVSYAPNREAAQSNYTTLLHLGPLSQHFSTQDMTGRQLTIERRADGSFGLSVR